MVTSVGGILKKVGSASLAPLELFDSAVIQPTPSSSFDVSRVGGRVCVPYEDGTRVGSIR